jgi:hypothetical protein
MWMKKLEENRYKKVYNSDARRVAWMVNNEGRTLDEMPISMKKKWSKAQYGRERYLATEFLKSKSEQMNEGKLTEINLQKVKKLVKKFKIPVVKYKKGQFAPNDVVVKTKGGRLETDKKAIDIFDKSGHHLETYDLDSKDVAKAFQHLKKISEEKLTSEQKLREQIREIIKEQLNEKTFGSQAQYDAYRKKHTLKPGTKVKVAGKTITVRGKGKMSKKAKSLGDRMADKLNKRMADLEKKRKQGKIKEAITGSDRKILFILVREIVRNLKSKIKNFDVNNKSHLNRVGSSILAIIRAMSYSPDNVNYKNFKKYFPKNFNSKLIQKKLKQFHSQNDKVQVTLVTQAIKNELGAGVNESKLRGMIREIIKEQLNLNEYIGAGKPIPRNKAKQLFVPENEMIRFSRVFKKLIQKGFVYIGDQTKEKKKISKHYTITVDKKMYDNLLDILMSKRFKVKT